MASERDSAGDARVGWASLLLASAVSGGMAWACWAGIPLATRMIALESSVRELIALERQRMGELEDLHAEVERLAGVVAAGPGKRIDIITPYTDVPPIDVMMCAHAIIPPHSYCDEHHSVVCHPSHPAHPVGQ